MKSLLFPWVPVYMRTYVDLPVAEFLFLPIPWNSCNQAPLAFKARWSGGSFGCQILRLGAWCGTQNFNSCERIPGIQLFSSFWVIYPSCIEFDCILSTVMFFLPSLLWLLFIFGLRISFLIGSSLFVNGCSAVSCDFVFFWQEMSSSPSNLPSCLQLFSFCFN